MLRRLDRRPALARLNVCQFRPHQPTTIASPGRNSPLPRIDRVICPLTTSECSSINTNAASSISAKLPKVTFSKPPIAEPKVRATCPVARRFGWRRYRSPIPSVAARQANTSASARAEWPKAANGKSLSVSWMGRPVMQEASRRICEQWITLLDALCRGPLCRNARYGPAAQLLSCFCRLPGRSGFGQRCFIGWPCRCLHARLRLYVASPRRRARHADRLVKAVAEGRRERRRAIESRRVHSVLSLRTSVYLCASFLRCRHKGAKGRHLPRHVATRMPRRSKRGRRAG